MGGRSLMGNGRGLLTGGGSSIPPPAHSAPTSQGGPRMLRGLDGPAAWRVWNLNHLWSRLRDFYQVRGLERKAKTGGEGEPLREGPSYSLPLCLQEELQLLILSPPPDLQTLGFDPLSGALPIHPLLPLPRTTLPSLPQLTPCGMCPAEEAVEQLEGVLRLLLGASVQVSWRWEGKARVELWRQRREILHQLPFLLPLSVSTGNSSSATSRASVSRSRASWPLPSRRY